MARHHVVIQTHADNFVVAYHSGYVAVTECGNKQAAQREADRLNALEKAKAATPPAPPRRIPEL
jgi:ArsR family metal-binding transcriptional regulator